MMTISGINSQQIPKKTRVRLSLARPSSALLLLRACFARYPRSLLTKARSVLHSSSPWVRLSYDPCSCSLNPDKKEAKRDKVLASLKAKIPFPIESAIDGKLPTWNKALISDHSGRKSKGSMSQLIHALGMKLRESVSSKVVYKVILVAHLEAIV